MALDDYSTTELSKYRIVKRWKYIDNKNIEYFYVQYKTLFGWSYIDDSSTWLSLNSSTFGAVSVGMSLIVIFMVFFISLLPGDNSTTVLIPFLILYAIISMIIWMKYPLNGDVSVDDVKDIIEERIKYSNRKKGYIETFDVSIKVQRKKKLEKLNKISK